MVVSEFVPATYLKATGKVATFATGSTKWLKILAIANMYIRQWSREPDFNWPSLYDPAFSIGAVTATDAFDLDSDIRTLSGTEGDYVRIFHTDAVGYTDYTIVDADRLKDYYTGYNKDDPIGNYCAQIGTQLVFNHKFLTTDDQYGGTIKVPAYLFPDDIVADGDTIPVDDPDWLVLISAAEYVRNDITRQGQYPFLVSEANQAMQRMKDDSSGQLDTVIQKWRPNGTNW